LTGLGVGDLKAEVARRLGADRMQAVALASERHRDALGRSVEALRRAKTALDVSTLEVVAGETAVALHALGEITGDDVRGELLDAIFQRFCIGK
jgi:tRNA modification GTPase